MHLVASIRHAAWCMNRDAAIWIATVVFAAWLGWYLRGNHEATFGNSGASVHIDTITKVIDHEPITITDRRATVRYVRDTVRWGDTVRVRDTVYTTRPFVAVIDTIIKHDTITAAYRFPQQTFSLALRRAPDSVRYEVRTVTLTNYEKREWWIDALGAIGAGGIGYAIGRAQ